MKPMRKEIADLIHEAMDQHELARDFYHRLAHRVSHPETREMFEYLAKGGREQGPDAPLSDSGGLPGGPAGARFTSGRAFEGPYSNGRVVPEAPHHPVTPVNIRLSWRSMSIKSPKNPLLFLKTPQ